MEDEPGGSGRWLDCLTLELPCAAAISSATPAAALLLPMSRAGGGALLGSGSPSVGSKPAGLKQENRARCADEGQAVSFQAPSLECSRANRAQWSPVVPEKSSPMTPGPNTHSAAATCRPAAAAAPRWLPTVPLSAPPTMKYLRAHSQESNPSPSPPSQGRCHAHLPKPHGVCKPPSHRGKVEAQLPTAPPSTVQTRAQAGGPRGAQQLT